MDWDRIVIFLLGLGLGPKIFLGSKMFHGRNFIAIDVIKRITSDNNHLESRFLH